ncbi:MAG: SPOR domain-containing protein, partial [Calditrichaceae bacterium]
KKNRINKNQMLNRFVKICFVQILIIATLFAQKSFDDIYTNFEQHNFKRVRQLLSGLDQQQQTSLDYQFFSAVFNKNGEEAKETFQLVFEKGNKPLKKYAAKKLMDYYYAKGYYINAAKFQEYLVDAGNGTTAITPLIKQQPEIPTVKPEQIPVSTDIYFIQVGAFSLEENAKQLVHMLATQNIMARIVERKIDQRNLFCVWLDGKEDFKKTYDYANIIKEKYDLKFRIIK